MTGREREEKLKEKFNNDASSLSDVELLELLLCRSEKTDCAEGTAKKLISVFGSLNGVLTAPREALSGLGVSENTAILLSLCRNIEKQVHVDASKNIKYLHGTEDAIRLCKLILCTEPLENMLFITLDENNKIINIHRLTVLGTVSTVTVNPQDLAKAAIFDNAHSVIISHNHPHGRPEVSKEDVEFTLKTTTMLREIGVLLADHIIIGENSNTSMRSIKKYNGYFD